MKLNSECMQDIMIFLEENIRYDENERIRLRKKLVPISPQTIYEKLPTKEKYNEDTFYYSLSKLYDERYIDVRLVDDVIYEVKDITTRGHNYINQIPAKNRIAPATDEDLLNILIDVNTKP